MSTPAISRPLDDPQGVPAPLVVLRYADVVLVVAALPFALLMGVPMLGFGVGAAAWIIQRIAGVAIERRARRSGDLRAQIGLNLGSMLVRAWTVGLAILVVGLAGEREDGLTAAVLILAAFTVYFALSLVLRPLDRKAP
jgi:hypothetical protein